MNDRSRPKAAPEALATTSRQHKRTQQYPVTGALIIDLTDVMVWNDQWPDVDEIRLKLAKIADMPRGTTVRLIVGQANFGTYLVHGLALSHVKVSVETDNQRVLEQWVAGLRGEME